MQQAKYGVAPKDFDDVEQVWGGDAEAKKESQAWDADTEDLVCPTCGRSFCDYSVSGGKKPCRDR